MRGSTVADLGALCSSGGWGRWGSTVADSWELCVVVEGGGGGGGSTLADSWELCVVVEVGGEGGGETMSVWQSMWAGLRRSIDTVS